MVFAIFRWRVITRLSTPYELCVDAIVIQNTVPFIELLYLEIFAYGVPIGVVGAGGLAVPGEGASDTAVACS